MLQNLRDSKGKALSLSYLLKIARHYYLRIVAVLVVFLLASTAYGVVKVALSDDVYVAKASLTVSEPTGTLIASELIPFVTAIADNLAYVEDDTDSVVVASDVAKRTISFSASAPTEEESIELANSIAQSTIEAARFELSDLASRYKDEVYAGHLELSGNAGSIYTLSPIDEKNSAAAYATVSMVVNEATVAENELGARSLGKDAVIGLVVGLFVVCCGVLVFALARTPVTGKDELESCFGIPVLSEMTESSPGERLWANIQFAEGERPRSMCLLPVEGADIGELAKQVQAAAQCSQLSETSDSVDIIACESLANDAQVIYQVHEADVTVLCLVVWKDSMKRVAATVNELELAHANVVGMVLGELSEYE